jgi:hypothetical protein
MIIPDFIHSRRRKACDEDASPPQFRHLGQVASTEKATESAAPELFGELPNARTVENVQRLLQFLRAEIGRPDSYPPQIEHSFKINDQTAKSMRNVHIRRFRPKPC